MYLFNKCSLTINAIAKYYCHDSQKNHVCVCVGGDPTKSYIKGFSFQVLSTEITLIYLSNLRKLEKM